MEPLSESSLAAMLGLVGALVTAGLGYHQWRRHKDREQSTRREDLVRPSREAMWQALEEIDLEIRAHSKEEGRPPPLHELLTKVNTAFKRNSLYLPEKIQALANEYISSLHAVAYWTALSKVERDNHPEWNFENTAPIEWHPGGRESVAATRKHLEAAQQRTQLKAILSASKDDL